MVKRCFLAQHTTFGTVQISVFVQSLGKRLSTLSTIERKSESVSITYYFVAFFLPVCLKRMYVRLKNFKVDKHIYTFFFFSFSADRPSQVILPLFTPGVF